MNGSVVGGCLLCINSVLFEKKKKIRCCIHLKKCCLAKTFFSLVLCLRSSQHGVVVFSFSFSCNGFQR